MNATCCSCAPNLACLFASFFLTFLAYPVSAGTTILYVDDDAPSGGGDGSSWDQAFDHPQDALDVAAASPGESFEIRVAQGTYKPTKRTDPTDPRSATFQLLNDVALRGGYAGVGAEEPDAHDPQKFVSTLSGDISTDFADAYHVVIGSGIDADAVISGFTVRDGAATGAGPWPATGHVGGGMLNVSGNPTIEACAFIANTAQAGGAIYNRQKSSPSISHCVFIDNVAVADGGAVRNIDGSNPAINNCSFLGNAAESGAGISVYECQDLQVTTCSFVGNSVTGVGGAVRMLGLNDHVMIADCEFLINYAGIAAGGVLIAAFVDATIERSVFRGNFAETAAGALVLSAPIGLVSNCSFATNEASFIGGGVICGPIGSATFLNCAFSRNTCSTQPGGGLVVSPDVVPLIVNCSFSGNLGMGIVSTNPLTLITNCVVWGNSPEQIYPNPYGQPPVVMFSAVQGGWPGEGNIDADPLFIQPGCDNLRLAYGSPCLDAGNNAAIPPDITTDLDGNPRIQNSIVDMGAYEGGHDMLDPAYCEDDLDAAESSVMVPHGGGFDPMNNAAAVIVNNTETDNNTASALQTDTDLHRGAGGFTELGDILTCTTSLANGEFWLRLYIPFDSTHLNGTDPVALDLTTFNEELQRWELAAASNTQNSPGHDGPLGDRIVVIGTGGPGYTFELGDYGVFWNPDLLQGLVWANVDHASDFGFGTPLPLCLGDAAQPFGVVDHVDLTAVLDGWGIAPPNSFVDIDHDGVIDINDLLAVINAWGSCP